MSLTKADMADHLFDEVGLNKREAKEFVPSSAEASKMYSFQTRLGIQPKLTGWHVFLCSARERFVV